MCDSHINFAYTHCVHTIHTVHRAFAVIVAMPFVVALYSHNINGDVHILKSSFAISETFKRIEIDAYRYTMSTVSAEANQNQTKLTVKQSGIANIST